MLNRKDFFKHALKLALPIMIQNLLNTLVNAADTFMLGYVSQTAMSAASLANQFTFVLFCFYYGMSTGTSVLVAQYWGKKDRKTVERVIGLATRMSVILSFVFFIVGFFLPRQIMQLFSNAPDTIEAGAEYLKIVSIGFVLMGISQVYTSALRSTEKVVLPSVIYVVSLGTNVFFNAMFIFGWFGVPKMGIVGVALGTVIARAVEVSICIVFSIFKSDVKIRIRYLFDKAGILFEDFLKICTPSIGNDVVWSLATSVFASILGHIGDDMVAANAVAVVVVNVGAIAMRGFANATTIIVSNALGENNIEAAKVYGNRMTILTGIVGVLGGIVIVALRPVIINYYTSVGELTPLAISYLGSIIYMTTWRLLGEGLNTCWICGCFRGGGDAKFGLIMDTVFMWGVAVPLMALAAYVIKLPPIWVYFVMSLDEFYKMPVVIYHYRKYKWLKNITRDMD